MHSNSKKGSGVVFHISVANNVSRETFFWMFYSFIYMFFYEFYIIYVFLDVSRETFCFCFLKYKWRTDEE